MARSPQHRCSSPVWAGGGDGHGDGGKGGDGGGDSPQQIFGAEFSRDRSTECSRENSSIFIRRRDDHNPFTISVREEGLGDGDGVEVTLGGGGGYLAEGTARERYANIGNPPSPFAVPADIRERGSDSGNHASPPRPPAFLASSPRGKGRHTSHAKLDLLLTEVQHISGRLSGIASRLDALERTGQKDRGDELSLGESGPDGGGAGTSMEIEASAGSRSSRSADLVSKKDGVPDAFQTVV